jgi:O-methyltransferase
MRRDRDLSSFSKSIYQPFLLRVIIMTTKQASVESLARSDRAFKFKITDRLAAWTGVYGVVCDAYRLWTGDSSYERAKPNATYAPWNKDAAFLETYQAVAGNTLVDKYRCFELWSLVEQTRHLEGALIEIGVWRGGTGALIAKKASLCGITDPVYLCDTFAGVVKASEKDSVYRGGELANTSTAIVEQLVQRLQLPNVKILEGIFPEDTAHLVTSQKFRLCHIDVDVYQSAKDVVSWIWDQMAIGGVMVYDDYGFLGCSGITAFVEEQMLCPDRIVLHNLNGHAIVVKIR